MASVKWFGRKIPRAFYDAVGIAVTFGMPKMVLVNK
jgi:hypothetical protein